ncbi:MAG TPA: NADH-quinone oxidoreductase subunit NuoG [Acidimicrobiales bacterium]|jgi:NADH-quinone oxidoreductase subunit G|nr:NADH-quinone oxidoreductase subunit NuoG [Acidimicrobiales bacterium]
MTQAAPGVVNIVVDGRPFEAREGELIIEAVERAGVYIPRFCYHPRMKPVGMCRMCLVEVSGPRGATLQPACFMSVSEGQEISTDSKATKKAQEGILEFLLVNHPLDCPVCDKGGECPLQDQAVTHGPGESRFFEEKRHWAKPISIGPLTLLDRERCIQCARCTRFAEEIAGEPLIDFFGRADAIEVAIAPGHPFDSYFSGNTVQICPVGALTSVPYRFKSRPWDLEQVESTCTYCSFGCRVAVQSSAGTLVRYLGIDSGPVNQSWLCDRGRYGFEATSAKERLTVPLVREAGGQRPASWNEALRLAADGILSATSGAGGAAAIGFIGGARLTNEDAYAWSKFARTVVRTDNVDCQLGDGLPADLLVGLPRATIEQACSAKAVVVLAGDLRDEVPLLHLRLRSAAANDGLQVIECSPLPTALSEVASIGLRYAPGEAAALAAALVASARAGTAAPAGNTVQGVPNELLRAAGKLLGQALSDSPAGEGIVVVLGRPSVSVSPVGVAAAAAAMHEAWPGARFLPAVRRANVFGALDMGLAPGLLPGRVGLEDGRLWFSGRWGPLPAEAGLDTTKMLEAAAGGDIRTLVLLGADPLSDFPDRELVARALEAVGCLISVDALPNASAQLADVLLPAAGPDEKEGTTTNLEGRVTRLGRKVVAPGLARQDWVIACELAELLDSDLGFASIDAIWSEIEQVSSAHSGCTLAALRAGGGDGIVVPVPATSVSFNGARRRPPAYDPMATPGISSVLEQGAPLFAGATVEDETAPDSGRPGPAGRPPMITVGGGRFAAPPSAPPDGYALRLVTRRSLYDEGILVQSAPSLAPLVPGNVLRLQPKELDKLGVSDGDEIRMTTATGELVIAAVADATVPSGVCVLPIGVVPITEAGATVLIDANAAVTEVRLETLSDA